MTRFIASVAASMVIAAHLPAPACATRKPPVEKQAKDPVKRVTVQEAFRDSASLEGQKVAIRGKVVKVKSAIMKKNWVHIQDGTGSPATGDDDITCTTGEGLPAPGTVVTVTGTLARNRDFGSGYFYRVILEDASFKK